MRSPARLVFTIETLVGVIALYLNAGICGVTC